jgi:hypothetical protein
MLESILSSADLIPSEGEQLPQWVWQFAPGFLALPLNVLQKVSELAKLRTMKKKDSTDRAHPRLAASC